MRRMLAISVLLVGSAQADDRVFQVSACAHGLDVACESLFARDVEGRALIRWRAPANNPLLAIHAEQWRLMERCVFAGGQFEFRYAAEATDDQCKGRI